MTEPDWRVLLRHDGRVELQAPASHDTITQAEASLGAVFPVDLRGLYLITDGIYDWPGRWFVIWPLADMIERNGDDWIGWETPARRQLLGFGDDGTGDPFCVPRDGTGGVFIWHPTRQEAQRLADTLEEFWLGWKGGEIST